MELKEYNGLYFEPETGKMYRADGSDTEFTFERATWTGPFGLHFAWPWLNPISFASHATGLKVLLWARAAAPGLLLSLDEVNRTVGPFSRTTERLIEAASGDLVERFSAGWLANSIIRHGEYKAADLWLAELRHAGFVV